MTSKNACPEVKTFGDFPLTPDMDLAGRQNLTTVGQPLALRGLAQTSAKSVLVG